MLLSIRDNQPFKRGQVELMRDLICLEIRIDESWVLRVNGVNQNGQKLYQLAAALNQIEKEKREKQRGEKERRLVVWVGSLNFFQYFFLEFRSGWEFNKFIKFNKRKGQKEERLQKMIGKDWELRDFNLMVNKDKEYSVEEMEEKIRKYQTAGLRNWFTLDYSFAHCQMKLFYNGFKEEERMEMWRETKEGQRLPSKEFYDVITKKASKSGLIGFDYGLKKMPLGTVKSFDIRSAYNGQFVRGDDFPIGEIKKIKEPNWNIVRELIENEKWFILVMKSEEKLNVPAWIDGKYSQDGFYEYVIGNYDYMTLKKIGFKLSTFNWKLGDVYTCDQTGYLNYAFRTRIVELFEKKEELKLQGDKDSAAELKAITEVLYGKGLQANDYKDSADLRKKYTVKYGTHYVMPQYSYHALQRTRYELVLMLERTGFEWAVAWDTDGIKTIEAGAEQIFSQRNQEIRKELVKAGFKNTSIGTWKFEGTFKYFIQFSNKVYAYSKDGNDLVCKFAGCRESAVKKLIEEVKDIDAFFEWAAGSSFKVKDGIRKRIYYKDTLRFEEKFFDYVPGEEEEL